MRLRTPIVMAALVAVVAALLAATPAEAAARYYAFVKTKTIAMSSTGNGKVALACHSSGKSCRGKISFAHDTGSPRTRSYSVPAGKTEYVTVSLHKDADDNPFNAPSTGRDYKSVSKVKLKVNEDSPRNVTHYYDNMTTETRVARQSIRGKVTGLGGNLATSIRVDLLRTLRGGRIDVIKGADVKSNGGSFKLDVNMGANNSPSDPYRLRVSGFDQDGNRRSYYWRGSNGAASGGGAHFRDGIVIRATKYGDYVADFKYGSISGSSSSGAEVTVAAPPPNYGGGSSTLRELDIISCANIYGQTKTNSAGKWSIGFLPMTSSANNRYMIGTRRGATEAWYGKSSTRYGSCYDATNYTKRSKANLITLKEPLTSKSSSAAASNNDIKINGSYSPAYRPTSQGDRWIRIREKVPGVKLLDMPVVAEGQADTAGNRKFTDLPPGTFYVEVGRRTGCADWYPSRFPNNRAYFSGPDRGSEQWKAFRKLSDLKGGKNSGAEYIARHANPNPATSAEQGRKPRGYAGWMYREYCKAYGAGTINTLSVSGIDQRKTKSTSRNPQGAVVKGRVTRAGGKTNKEIMVRLSSSAGTKVIRTDITDGSGTFYVAGLSSGTWRISVNSDSWRGIDRTFSGRHSIRVKAGRGYNVGTLRFKG